MNLSNLKNKIIKFPNSPGVYIFYDKNKVVLYVGKATSLKDRVGSYFKFNTNARIDANDANMQIIGNRPIEMMIYEVADIEIKKTDTVLEAYILEQELIKKFQPKYNVDGKDDKSFSYMLLTKEDFPRFLVIRKTELEKLKTIAKKSKFKIPNIKYEIRYTKVYGPYTSKKQIEIALKILRKIFPYHNRKENSEKGCLDYQIGLCPGPYDDAISKSDYKKNIRGIQMILEGKKKNLIFKLRKEMAENSKKQDFENAARIRNQIFALQHVQDIALISQEQSENFKLKISNLKFRIEGYDISNISGKFNVGSMVVFDNSSGKLEPNKEEYRKFKIKTISGANDIGAMREVLIRRFQNNWTKPDLILLDGGAGHLNMARQILKNYKIEIPIISVAKGPKRKKLDIRIFGSVPKISKKIIEQIRDEAHRFAIKYHKKIRSNSFLK